MNRIARSLAALLAVTALTAAVQAPADAAPNSVVLGNGHWCC